MIAHSTSTYPGAPAAGLVQPVLTGLDGMERVDDAAARERPASSPRAASQGDRRARRRYWSVRDLSRRLWVGRGYELLRELIRSGLLPATRSARSWWIDDEDAASLEAAFDDRAGKVRAFRGLEAWLQARSYSVPVTPEVEALIGATQAGFIWRGTAYLPHAAWTAETGADGAPEYCHRNGWVVDVHGEAALVA